MFVYFRVQDAKNADPQPENDDLLLNQSFHANMEIASSNESTTSDSTVHLSPTASYYESNSRALTISSIVGNIDETRLANDEESIRDMKCTSVIEEERQLELKN